MKNKKQANSSLLCLPLSLRDKIWIEILQEGVKLVQQLAESKPFGLFS